MMSAISITASAVVVSPSPSRSAACTVSVYSRTRCDGQTDRQTPRQPPAQDRGHPPRGDAEPTSRSRPLAITLRVPVALLTVNMWGWGSRGSWLRME